MSNLDEIIARLQSNEVVAYPTEAVFGLGCNPNSEAAVQALLTLKQRPVEKGLILLDTIAVRLCYLPAVATLCEAAGLALTSTSANLTGLPPCRTAQEVYAQFGNDFPVLEQATGGAKQPSEIRDIFTQHIFRQG